MFIFAPLTNIAAVAIVMPCALVGTVALIKLIGFFFPGINIPKPPSTSSKKPKP